MTPYFQLPPRTRPGLFIASLAARGGKSVVACAIANALRRQQVRVGPFKPIATGCRSERGSLMSPDAEALAHFADLDPGLGGLSLVNPVAISRRGTPALSLALAGKALDSHAIARALERLDAACDLLVVEGVGSATDPLDPARPPVTALDLATELGYPVVLVADPRDDALGVANAVTMALRIRGVPIAGLVINRYEPDDPEPATQASREWLSATTGLPILTTLPRVHESEAAPERGVLHDDLLSTTALVDWRRIARPPLSSSGFINFSSI
ncbi:MAG: ATP-dependent dethiobiotin synthetase BioD [Phycisphaerales bacterium]